MVCNCLRFIIYFWLCSACCILRIQGNGEQGHVEDVKSVGEIFLIDTQHDFGPLPRFVISRVDGAYNKTLDTPHLIKKNLITTLVDVDRVYYTEHEPSQTEDYLLNLEFFKKGVKDLQRRHHIETADGRRENLDSNDVQRSDFSSNEHQPDPLNPNPLAFFESTPDSRFMNVGHILSPDETPHERYHDVKSDNRRLIPPLATKVQTFGTNRLALSSDRRNQGTKSRKLTATNVENENAGKGTSSKIQSNIEKLGNLESQNPKMQTNGIGSKNAGPLSSSVGNSFRNLNTGNSGKQTNGVGSGHVGARSQSDGSSFHNVEAISHGKQTGGVESGNAGVHPQSGGSSFSNVNEASLRNDKNDDAKAGNDGDRPQNDGKKFRNPNTGTKNIGGVSQIANGYQGDAGKQGDDNMQISGGDYSGEFAQAPSSPSMVESTTEENQKPLQNDELSGPASDASPDDDSSFDNDDDMSDGDNDDDDDEDEIKEDDDKKEESKTNGFNGKPEEKNDDDDKSYDYEESSDDNDSSNHKLAGSDNNEYSDINSIDALAGDDETAHSRNGMMGGEKGTSETWKNSGGESYSKSPLVVNGKEMSVLSKTKDTSNEEQAEGSLHVQLSKEWDWRKFIRGFRYESLGQACVGFLIDEHITKHMPMVQRWVYNLALFFKTGSYISVSTYGKTFNKVTDFRTYASSEEVKGALKSGINSKQGRGRKIGVAMEEYHKLYQPVIKKSGFKGVLFIFVKGPNDAQDVAKMGNYGELFTQLGVTIYFFGLGSKVQFDQLKVSTAVEHIFTISADKDVVLGGSGLKAANAKVTSSLFMFLFNQLKAGFGERVGVGATSVSSALTKDWWNKKWGWYEELGLRYQSIGRANLAFVIDTTQSDLVLFIQRYVYNFIRLFQSRGTYVTILSYGKTVSVVSKWLSFSSAQDIQKSCANINFAASSGSKRDSGAAFDTLLKMYTSFRSKGESGENPNFSFWLLTGKSSVGVSSQIRLKLVELGIKLWGFGIGSSRSSFSAEIKSFVGKDGVSVEGDLKALVSKANFDYLQQSARKIAHAGNAMEYTAGNKAEAETVQKKWNWKKGSKKIHYGTLARSNIAFLLDGTVTADFGYIRRFVFNIIKMFSLTGTSVSIYAYGSSVYRTCSFEQIRSEADIKKEMEKIPKVLNGVRYTGKALARVASDFNGATPGNPNILFCMAQGKSADDVVPAANNLRKYGIKTYSIGIGTQNSRQELAQIAFSGATIFQTNMNGLVSCAGDIEASLKQVLGTVSKATGEKGHVSSTSSGIIKTWHWKTSGYNFHYESVAKSSVLFLIDGTNKNHFDVLQKLAFNILRLFESGTSISIITYGDTQDSSLATFRTYSDVTAIQTVFASIRFSGKKSGCKIGAALKLAKKTMVDAPKIGTKSCFLFATQKSQDGISEPGKALVSSGVNVFAFGIGDKVETTELRKVSSYYLVGKWKKLLGFMVKVQNTLVKVIGKSKTTSPETGVQPEVPKGEPERKPTLPAPTTGFVASSTSQPVTELQTKWNWFSMTRLSAATLGASNFLCLLDVSQESSFAILIRFVAQIMMLFKYSETKFSLITYSSEFKVEFTAKSFQNENGIQEALKMVQPKPSKKINTGSCMKFAKENELSKYLGDTTKPTVMFLITTRKSSDDISKIAEQIEGSGCKAFGVGVGGSFSQEEINMVGLTGQMSLSSSEAQLPGLLSRILFSLHTIVNGLPSSQTHVSLQTMTSEQPSLATNVMNTVQTGSVPSETTGQAGLPNTGATMDDISGTDNGAGTAGTPEEGGTGTDKTSGMSNGESPGTSDNSLRPGSPGTEEAGTPGTKKPGNPGSGEPGKPGTGEAQEKPTSATAGGKTGGGGTDVSTGGGSNGVTEAITGQSKVDGGPGGLADGKVTNGDSNGNSKPDGSSSKTPVTPEGEPATPTNEDGSPGKGPVKPDGTASTPVGGVATSPNGDPQVGADGSPILNQGGSEVPQPTPKPIDTGSKPANPGNSGGGGDKPGSSDGTTTVTNPDGSQTVTNPDGTPTKTNPTDGSPVTGVHGSPDNPDGTTTVTNPDGSQQIKNPDGTPTQLDSNGTPATGTNVGGGDGTTPGGGLSSQPGTNDGTTTVTNPDGSKTVTNPDGTPTKTNPTDGSPATGVDGPPSNPDGTTTVTNPDGSQQTKNPDGTPTQLDSNGTPATGTNVGGGDGTTPGGGLSSQPGINDGTTTETNPDGSQTVTNPDGTPTKTNPTDGSPVTGVNGPPSNPDGTTTVTNPDGSQKTKNPDGTPTQLDSNGNPATGTNVGGGADTPAESGPGNNGDGTTTITNPDGTTTVVNPDGSHQVKNPDGTPTKLQPNGTPDTVVNIHGGPVVGATEDGIVSIPIHGSGDGHKGCHCMACECTPLPPCNARMKKCLTPNTKLSKDVPMEKRKNEAIVMAIQTEEKELKSDELPEKQRIPSKSLN